MKITRLTLWRVALISKTPYYMASGKTCDVVDTMVLRLDTDSGLCGFGETCPILHYLPAYANGVAPALAEMASVILGADPVGPVAVMTRLDKMLPGHPYAKSAVDIALWDITAQAAGLPLFALLGGRQITQLPLYHSITCVAPEEMAKIAKESQKEGITQFQVKLGVDANWEADVARLRLVREAVGTAPLVYGDWNCGVTRLYATRVGRALRPADVMLEQPCKTLEDCAAVKKATGLPMKIDENAHDTDSLLRAYALGCMDAVAVKLSKFGGLSAAACARDLCIHLGAQMCVEDAWGSDVAMMAALHLAASTAPGALLNVCDLSGYVTPRLDLSCPTRRRGCIRLDDRPGLGATPDPDTLGEAILEL